MAGRRNDGSKRHRLSVYLLKPKTKLEEAVEEKTGLKKFELEIVGARKALLWIRQSSQNPPSWLDLFSDQTAVSLPKLFNASNAAVLLIQGQRESFALTFGFGKHLLHSDALDETFGLKATLNAIDSRQIRTIDRDSLDVVGRRTREQVARAGAITEFGINFDQDLVRAVTGRPLDKNLGKTLSGADGLVITLPLMSKDLAQNLNRLAEIASEKRYREVFPWIDNVREVRDPSKRQQLDDAMLQRLRKGSDDKIWLAVPEIIDWENFGGFRYSGFRHRATIQDIYMPEFLEICPERENLTIENLKSWAVHRLDAASEQKVQHWSIYQCLYAEVQEGDEVFLLNAGKWYRITRSFVDEITTEVDALISSSAIPDILPPCHQHTEPDYNRAVEAGDRTAFACLDKKLIQYGGARSSIEFCDLVTTHGSFIHVKRYSGSSVLSHLFAQGVVSAETFAADSRFRIAANKLLRKEHKLNNPTQTPQHGQYRVVYAIISKAAKPLNLPFFSKVSLRVAARRLKLIGFQVAVIGIEDKSSNINGD